MNEQDSEKKQTWVFGGDSPETTTDCHISEINLYGRESVSVKIAPKTLNTERGFEICKKCFLTCSQEKIEEEAEYYDSIWSSSVVLLYPIKTICGLLHGVKLLN